MSDEYWKAHIFDEGIFGVKFDDCHSVGWDIEGLCPDCEKYMCLIAAAPDLLEACKLLMTFNLADVIASAGGTPYSEKIEWFDFVHLVERAVAKGESL